MKIARREFKSDGQHVAAYFVYCPACERAHRLGIIGNSANFLLTARPIRHRMVPT